MPLVTPSEDAEARQYMVDQSLLSQGCFQVIKDKQKEHQIESKVSYAPHAGVRVEGSEGLQALVVTLVKVPEPVTSPKDIDAGQNESYDMVNHHIDCYHITILLLLGLLHESS